MGIPTAQLESWSVLPDPGRSAQTYDTVNAAIDRAGLRGKYFSMDVFLQGSYANATNIRADSDVDVVVEMESTYRRTISALSPQEQRRYLAQALPAQHTLSEFKQDVRRALIDYYGTALVSEGNKCFKVAPRSQRLPIDVLPCQEHRSYFSFPDASQARHVDGIYFETRDGRGVINYPKQHRSNGQTKHGQTNQMYKRVVRTMKNARRKLAEDGAITRDVAPSYFVECLLFNVPNGQFVSDLRDSYYNTLIWLGQNAASLPTFKCQNGIIDLFGSTPEQWDTTKATALIGALLNQWSDWT